VGISDALAKLVVRQILKPAFELDQPVRVVCREGGEERLLAELATYRLDVVLAEQTPSEAVRVKTFDHTLGECGLTFFAAPRLAAELAQGFPGSLDGAPAMLPTRSTAMRRNLERWFDGLGVRPNVVAEFDDQALLMVFATDELGFFAVPSVIGDEVGRRYGAEPFGQTDECRERFVAITAERKLKHPAVVAITEAARASLFG
jgi:LysR family transcriptional activator of nhaA